MRWARRWQRSCLLLTSASAVQRAAVQPAQKQLGDPRPAFLPEPELCLNEASDSRIPSAMMLVSSECPGSERATAMLPLTCIGVLLCRHAPSWLRRAAQQAFAHARQLPRAAGWCRACSRACASPCLAGPLPYRSHLRLLGALSCVRSRPGISAAAQTQAASGVLCRAIPTSAPAQQHQAAAEAAADVSATTHAATAAGNQTLATSAKEPVQVSAPARAPALAPTAAPQRPASPVAAPVAALPHRQPKV